MTTEDPCDSRAQRERKFFAEWGVNPAGDKLRWRRELDLLRRARPGGLGSVLSLGCGRGWFETLLAKHADHVLGIDLSPESIEAAKALAAGQRITNTEFICADVGRFELERSFDTVVCVAFLHHLSDRKCLDLLARIHRHLREGGLLHTQDPNAHGLLRRLGRRCSATSRCNSAIAGRFLRVRSSGFCMVLPRGSGAGRATSAYHSWLGPPVNLASNPRPGPPWSGG